MPKPLDLPPDLLELQQAVNRANDALRECARGDGEWTDERLEELASLRRAFTDAADAVYQHPVTRQSVAEGCYHQTHQALIDAAREPAAV
ncbi:hypothetical protein [Peterkaempfera sp. SMS 1(5)a]|uniref:hypothetical protein n=1 Tax=Peterkaempfera podocarpi TaxID=3232308 RepID=UPI00366DF3EE